CCLLLHILVWAFVHFTDVRWTSLEPAQGDHTPVVVRPAPTPGPSKSLAAAAVGIRTAGASEAGPADGAGAQVSGLPAPAWPVGTNVPATVSAEPTDPNIVLGRGDVWLRHISGLTQALGI